MSTAQFIVITCSLFALSWLTYDICVVKTKGTSSGETLSWTIYLASKKYIAIPFFVGLIFGLLFGHLFLDMPGS